MGEAEGEDFVVVMMRRRADRGFMNGRQGMT